MKLREAKPNDVEAMHPRAMGLVLHSLLIPKLSANEKQVMGEHGTQYPYLQRLERAPDAVAIDLDGTLLDGRAQLSACNRLAVEYGSEEQSE